jgi:NAD(P)-dependent dehydrogenase (short-subunit alcohol dehydrogenase family)
VAWFVEAGATVIGCGRSVSEVEALRAQYGPPHDFCAVDVSDESQVAMWSARVLAMENAPDLVINNAGVIAPNAPLWKTPAEEIARVLGVNVAGTAAVIRHFAPAMIARGRGVFVNFSSGWGRSTSPEVAIYCASKWAIEGLTRALAQELPAGLAAVSLNPGIINTQMLRSCFGGSAAEYPEPSEWAQAAGPFLLGLGAAQNGASLDVPAA